MQGSPSVPTETEQDIVARITERLRRDHPDPDMRAKLYAEDKLGEYVQVLMGERSDDAALVKRVATAVQHADDGTPAHDE